MRVLVLILNRMLWFVPTLIGLMIITFTISHIIPADPVAFFAGENATAEQIEALRARYGFDKPLHIQLVNYLIGVTQGDLGISIYTQRPISEDLLARLPATMELTFMAVFFFYDCRCSAWCLCRRLSKLFFRPFFESPYSLWACNC